MQHLYFMVALGVLVSAAAVVSLVSALRHRNRWPYQVDATLFSAEQRALHKVLEQAVGAEYQVFGKIRAADIIAVNRRLDRRRRDRAEQRAADSLFDFVVCVRETTAIVCAVNLRPSTGLWRRMAGDRLDRICAAAGLPFVCLRAAEVYAVQEVADAVFAAMGPGVTLGRGSVVSDREAGPVLRDLAEAIDSERRGTRSGGTAPTPRRRDVTTATPAPPAPPLRTEPRLSIHDDIDLGPDLDLATFPDEVASAGSARRQAAR
jgi:hypothetical protein